MSGHVFVLHADLLRLECDAWLLPGDSRSFVERYWKVGPAGDLSAWEWPPEFWAQDARSVALEGDRDAPRPFLTHVGGGSRRPAEWFVEGAVEFVRVACVDLARRGAPPRRRRQRPLLAMPIVGTGIPSASKRS